MQNSLLKIGIVGLGLIGGSLAKVLSSKNYTVTGVAYSDSTHEKASKLNIFKSVSNNIEDLNGCNVIFIATPINTINITFQKLNSFISRPCIITDVASIKGDVSDFANKTFSNEMISFIPGHPMAGTEHKGIDNSFEDLFKGCKWVLCPTSPEKKQQVDVLSQIIQETGATVIYANPYQHDIAVALISHMPLLVSMGLIDTINTQEDFVLKELAFYLAASGYRDTTRIACGNSELSYDMLKFNQKNVLKALDMFEEAIHKIRAQLDMPKEDTINKFDEIANLRKQLYSKDGNNIYKGIFNF